jgi:small subunit ribosomal protein S3Ae
VARRKQIGRRVEGWKAKSWFKVYAPESFEKVYIGDTISGNPENVVGRVMQTTLGEMTHDYSKQQIKVRFRVDNVAGDAAYTQFVGHAVTRDYLRALVKRRTSRIDSIVLVTTKEGKKIRLTVTCLTLSRANISQVHAVRKLITEQLVQTASKMDFDSFVKEVVSGDASRELFKNVKLIFPVRRVDIIKSRLEEAAVLTPLSS